MSRTTNVVILCEDRQHAAFARRFLGLAGTDLRVIREEISPAGRGSGEQFVRVQYPKELAYYRSRAHRVGQALLVIIDADKRSLADRVEQIEADCERAGVPRREAGDRVAVFVPGRNVETWLAYLAGETVDEAREKPYPRLDRERDCQPHARALFEMCRALGLRKPAPASLEAACTEYNQRIRR